MIMIVLSIHIATIRLSIRRRLPCRAALTVTIPALFFGSAVGAVKRGEHDVKCYLVFAHVLLADTATALVKNYIGRSTKQRVR